MLDASMLLTPEQELDERFEYIQIGLASPQRIRSWSRGAVTKPETINYRTLRPERDGLFCERIFGPAKDWECHCGKYKRVRHRGIVCERCGVEVTDSKVRRHRMGHIELAAPVVHVWYLKGIPSHLSLLLDIPLRQLEDVIYFNVYVVLDPGNVDGLHKNQILSEEEYEMLMSDPDKKFRADMGAAAIRELLNNLKLRELSGELRKEMGESAGQKKAKVIKRLRIVEAFINAGAHPAWIVLDTIPVIPPDLRPMVQLDGGRFATSDLNDLYRRVINRNNRLFRLMEMEAPDIIVRNEMRMLQEAVDALIDNGRRGRAVVGQNSRALKSLSDIIEGKQGRFRQNLLGKRVDYSGRSVIVVGPKLKLHQCGLPKEMALELFKPFVMNKLVERAIVQNIKSAKKKIERQETVVWDILEEVIKGHPVLLNRAPTLHRLGIQAFEPVLVEGRAIQLHPLVCVAFNADFDGDQMAVHVPLSVEAQTEARLLMLSTHNVLLPATGKPVITPTQDMILGIYYLTLVRPDKTVKQHHAGKVKKIDSDPFYGTHRIVLKTGSGDQHYEIPAAYLLTKKEGDAVDVGDVLATYPAWEGMPFHSITEALAAFYQGVVTLHTLIKVRIPAEKGVMPTEPEVTEAELKSGRVSPHKIVQTTAGRLLFNEVLPAEFPLVNQTMDKGAVEKIISQAFARLGSTRTAELADQLKNLGFRYATQGGVSIAIEDLEIPAGKKDILAAADAEIEKSQKRYLRGEITEVERYNKVIDTWSEATDKLTGLIKTDYDRMNSVYMMAFSGARGNISQVRQLVGMRGLMADPSGRIIGLPIKSNFREGLNVTEYIISSYGARKGIVDTALRTADSGYLTRRLADVAQDVIITETDCGTSDGIYMETLGSGDSITVHLADRLVGRYAADPVKHPETGATMTEANSAFSRELADAIERDGVKRVKIRSALTCHSGWGICGMCYGWGLTTNVLVDIGEAIGIIAAQSIGEPGTQLTMRTFHTGGVFQSSQRHMIRAQQAGTVKLDKLQTRDYRTRHGETTLLVEKEGVLNVQSPKKGHNYTMPAGYELRVKAGQAVKSGDILAEAGPYANVGERRVIEKAYKEIVSDLSGAVRFIGFKPEEKKDRQGNVTKIANKNGVIWVLDGEVYSLPLSAQLLVKAGQRVQVDDIIAKMQISSDYGGRVHLSQDGREVSIITAQLACPTVEVAQAKRETVLRIHDEKSPIKTMHLLVSEGSRVETTGSALAEAVDERYIVPTGGEVRYLDCEVNDKGVVTGTCKLLFIPEEQISLGPNDIPMVTKNQWVEAETEVIPGRSVKSPGYLQAEDADISQQMTFYPNAEVHVLDLETELTVQAGQLVKKGAALTNDIHAKQPGLVEIIATETERTVIVRAVQEYKVNPVGKFIDYERNNDQLDLIPLTRLAVRNGERVREGAALVKINLMLTLQSLATTLGCKVEFARNEDDTMTNLRLSVVEMLSLRRGGMYEESFRGYRGLRSTTNLQVKEGQEIQSKTVIAETEYRTTVSGEVEVKATLGEINKMLIITEDHMTRVTLPPGTPVEPGQLIYQGDEMAPGIVSPEACIIHKVNVGGQDKPAKGKSKTAKLKEPAANAPVEVLLRRARPYLVNQGTQVLVDQEGMVSRGETLAILVFDQVKTGDIIQGLPRVEELLEARKPKESAVVAKLSGTVELESDADDNQRVFIRDADSKRDEVSLPIGSRPIVQHGEVVVKGQPVTDGAVNPHDILELLGLQDAQQLLVDSVQSVYRSQGVDIADKHIETIVRQMTRKVRIEDPGDSIYLQGEQIEKRDVEEENRRLESESKSPIITKAVLLGITKASLNTESFISAASFQETTRVLTEAAINGKKDFLRGLKENVIIGRLIPAGTGMPTNMAAAETV